MADDALQTLARRVCEWLGIKTAAWATSGGLVSWGAAGAAIEALEETRGITLEIDSTEVSFWHTDDGCVGRWPIDGDEPLYVTIIKAADAVRERQEKVTCPHCGYVLTTGDTTANCRGSCVWCGGLVVWDSERKDWAKEGT